jgi:hypothetical protein
MRKHPAKHSGLIKDWRPRTRLRQRPRLATCLFVTWRGAGVRCDQCGVSPAQSAKQTTAAGE